MNQAAFTLTIMYVMNLVLAPLSSSPHGGWRVGGRRSLCALPFFISQHDKGFKGEFFPAGSEAERRISSFVQSFDDELSSASANMLYLRSRLLLLIATKGSSFSSGDLSLMFTPMLGSFVAPRDYLQKGTNHPCYAPGVP